MKLKLRLDKATVQEFFIQNVEKIVFGVAALVFLLLVYSAFTASGISRRPSSCGKPFKTERPRLPIRARTGLEMKDYEAQAKQSRVRTDEKLYATAALWDPPLFQEARVAHDARSCTPSRNFAERPELGRSTCWSKRKNRPADEGAGGAGGSGRARRRRWAFADSTGSSSPGSFPTKNS